MVPRDRKTRDRPGVLHADLEPAKYQLALAEFEALRAEVLMRIEKQQDILNFVLVIVAALTTYATSQDRDALLNLDTLADHAVLLALASMALSGFALMTLDHEMNIAHATRYMYEVLPPFKRDRAESGLTLNWNAHRAHWQQGPGPGPLLATALASAKYVLTIAPSAVLLLITWYAVARDGREPIVVFAAIAASTLLCTVAFTAAYTGRLWKRMAK